MRKLIIGLAMLALASPGLAQWELDSEQSSLNFISVKNASVAETHRFATLVGHVGGDGQASVTIDLDSVDTLIPIRDERMRAMLFNTEKYPTAKVTAEVDPAILAAVADGGTVNTELALELSMHGMEGSVTAPVLVFGDTAAIHVVSTRPMVIGAADFGMVAGVEALREVAGLANISTAVPVTVNLLFRRAP